MDGEVPDLPSSWDVEDDAVSRRRSRAPLVVGAVIAVLVLAGVVFGVARQQEEQVKTAWPYSYSGPPDGLTGKPADADPDTPPGYYLWSDFEGWHLWVVNGDGVAGARGTITSSDTVAVADPATPGEGTTSRDGKTATFDLPAEPRVVGIDFNPGFYGDELTIEIADDDGAIDVGRVTVGHDLKPDELPLVLEKVEEAKAPTS